MLSASASARKSRAEPDAFGHIRVRFLTGKLCLGQNALVTGQKIALTGGKRGFPGTVWWTTAFGQEKVQWTLQFPSRILKVPIEQNP